jgi:RNA recognition motif-containing protein
VAELSLIKNGLKWPHLRIIQKNPYLWLVNKINPTRKYSTSRVYLSEGLIELANIYHLISKTKMNIYVANIPWKASEEQLKQLFAEYGEVSSAKIIMDKVTQRSRGFGFIEMADDTAGRNAVNELNGADFMGKNLVVNEARPREEGSSGGSSRGGNRGGGGGFRRGDFNKDY